MPKSLRAALFVAAVGVLTVWGVTASADCGSPANAVEAENCLPGDAAGAWDLAGKGDLNLPGFATEASVNRGETIAFRVSASAAAARIDIYRLGYYRGDGARRVATIPDGSVSASWAVPSNAVSGLYLARLVGESGGTGAGQALFVVRNDGGTSDILFQTSSTSLRSFSRTPGARTAPEDGLRAELPMVRWLERNGYDVSYFTATDAERRGGEILGHRVYLSAGRDATWSARQRAAIEAALDHTPPVHLAFFGVHDAADTAGATRVPESALTGTTFAVQAAASAVQVPEADGRMRFWRDTPNVANLAPAAVWTGPEGTLGREWGEDRDDGTRPAGLVRLATRVGETATHHALFHKRPSGALVFSAGTLQWSRGLDASVDMQQATVNLLADMGVQPATLQAGLVPASASIDVVPPVSDVTVPAGGSAVSALLPVLVQGTATDGAPGQVGGVEVSVDGGATWHAAQGRESWSYLWTPPANGTFTILSRAVDDSGNLETPSAGRALTVGRDASRYAARAPLPRDFVTAAAGTFTDTLDTDFAAGTPDANIAITAVSDGEVELGNAPGSAEFAGSALPGDWVSFAWPSGGTSTVTGGFLVVDGARANTVSSLSYNPGTAVEFVATFGAAAFQNVGFGVGNDVAPGEIFNTDPLAVFGTGDGTQVVARVITGGFVQDAPLGAALLNTSHTYKIVWRAAGFDFYVDNTLVHTQPTAVAGPMRIAVSDLDLGGPTVSVDWLHVLSHPAAGTFVSRVFNSGVTTTSWKAMTWTAGTPAGTALAMSARIGTTNPPTGAWIPISASGTVLGGTARYMQYRAVLSTTDTLVTPVLQRVDIAYDTTVPDTTPPTIVTRTPAPSATGVPVGSAVVVQFSEVMNAGTITGSTLRLRAVGAPADVAATVAPSGNLATLTPSAALSPGTNYTVTLLGTVADLSGNPLGSDAVWTFATATPSFTDTALADFQAALTSTCTVGSYESGGDVLLTPSAASAPATSGFDGAGLPAGWVVTPWTGGTGTVAGGTLTVDGARVDTGTITFAGPRALEFVATFGPEMFQNVGWGNELNLATESWALFGTAATTNTIYARTNDGVVSSDVAIAGSWVGSPHRYRIQWQATQVVYSIDGSVVHTEPIAVTGNLRPVISDFTLGGTAVLAVGGLRVSPFTTPCTLESRVVDAGLQVSWNGLSWTRDTPSTGTALAMSARSGNTAVPDGTWTAYTAVAAPGSMNAGIGRYAQYRAVLSATDTTRTPVLSDVTLSSGAAPTYTLTTTVAAPTHGTITSNPAGINCGTGGTDCTEIYPYGTVVALTPTPDTGYSFSAWTGACTGAGACNVTMNGARTVGATFTIQRLALTVTAPTGGTITSAPAGINCGSGGSVCSALFDYNTVVTMTATPATGYNFGAWTGDCTGTGACSVTMTAAHALSATFTIQRFTLTVTAPTNGTITASGGINCGTGGSACSAMYDYGTNVPLTATPDTGYGLTTWTGVCSGTGACSANMTTDRTVGATFSILRLTLTITPPTHGTVTGSGGINCGTGGSACNATFDYGTPVPLTATPDANYDFAGWTGACSGTGACAPVMTANRTVGASFTIQRFALTVGAPTGGTITGTGINCGVLGSDCSEIYDWGTVVNLTQTAATGYDFTNWTGDCTGAGTCSVTMTTARAVGAIFTIQRFALTVTPPTHGTITGSGINCGTGGSLCSATFDYGTVVPLAAVPDTGYNLGGWTGACSGTGACNVTVNAAKTVGASFTIQRHTLTVTQPTHGTVTGTGITCGTGGVDCTETFDYGTVVPLTATADSGYNFGSWSGACTGSGACSVTMTAARTVGATFLQRFTLTVTKPTHGTITANGISCGTAGNDCTETYDYGTVVAVTAVPDAGRRLRMWTGVCTGTGACSTTMTANRAVSGIFGLAFGGTRVAPGSYEGPGFVTNEEATPGETPPPTTAPVAPVERTEPSSRPASAPEPALETEPAPGPATEPKPEPVREAAATVPDGPRVFVTGDVRHPGAYAWFPGMTAQQLVSLAGGVPSEGRFAIVREAGPEGELGLDTPVTAGETFLVRRRPN